MKVHYYKHLNIGYSSIRIIFCPFLIIFKSLKNVSIIIGLKILVNKNNKFNYTVFKLN